MSVTHPKEYNAEVDTHNKKASGPIDRYEFLECTLRQENEVESFTVLTKEQIVARKVIPYKLPSSIMGDREHGCASYPVSRSLRTIHTTLLYYTHGENFIRLSQSLSDDALARELRELRMFIYR